MIILLDIDGVLVTTPAWRKPELLPDGFMKFDEAAAKELAVLIAETSAEVVLTSTHRINYSEEQWLKLFAARGIAVESVKKLNQNTDLRGMRRLEEIIAWVEAGRKDENYVIIDDDASLEGLPEGIKQRWVRTMAHEGLTLSLRMKAGEILGGEK